MTGETSLIAPSLLRRPCKPSWYYGDELTFHDEPEWVTDGEPILITDPFYLADISDRDAVVARAVRENGVILCDFGGDVSCPVWWWEPWLILPLWEATLPAESTGEVEMLARRVFCDSAAFVFLPVTRSLPLSLQRRIAEVVEEGKGALLPLPAGSWSFWNEEAPGRAFDTVKIVARYEPREPTAKTQMQFEW